MRADPDLASVRDHPDYAAILKRVEETEARQAAVFRRRADASEPLIFPPPDLEDGAAEPRPLVVLLHGRGGRAQKMADLFRPSAAKIGAVLVVPEAFEPYGGGFQWGRLEDAFYRVEGAIERAAERFPVDRRRVILAGFSQGGYISLAGALRHPPRFAGVVAIGSCNTMSFELAAADTQDLPRIYIGIGSEDRSHDDCRPMVETYEAAGFEAKLRVYKGYGHVFPQNYKWEIDRAFKFVLKTGS